MKLSSISYFLFNKNNNTGNAKLTFVTQIRKYEMIKILMKYEFDNNSSLRLLNLIQVIGLSSQWNENSIFNRHGF